MSGRAVIALLLAAIAAAVPAAAAEAPPAPAVAAAIEKAIRARVGESAEVSVSDVSGVRVVAAPRQLLAQPEPGAKVGGRMRFLLADGGGGRTPVRVGEATAIVDVLVPAVRVRRPVSRGDRFDEADVEAAQASLTGRLLRPLPQRDEALRARATRDLGEDAILLPGDLAREALIRTGDVVQVHVRVDGIEMVAERVAAENGNEGDLIRILNEETKQTLRARVVGRGEVEVVVEGSHAR